MSDERPTVRPVNLGRLVELTHLCRNDAQSTDDIVDALDVSKRRARETILESTRISLVEEISNKETYSTTTVGERFIDAVESSDWEKVNSVLKTHSPHYGEFLSLFEDGSTVEPDAALELLENQAEFTPYEYNETSLDVIGAWAQRLGAIQRNAFDGTFYAVKKRDVPPNFPYALLSVADSLEESAGVNLKKRYLSIPELREHTCECLSCDRATFDEGLRTLAQQNIGRIELSGAPIDTGAKEARYGLKTIELADEDGELVSTDQSSEQVMRGVEQLGKQYYYLAVYDRELQFNNNDN
ncbi:hypothetical protein [Halopenitus persicus]|uniref:Uncharacterized protein n=1 Tax=Halopenitus persicus TaxID=1048396 RepID=A0A1H3NP85_9EURY|nr:hypothetical protein [Halopenitus persicus]SDY90634.1 hypothetical protein SAMN05216564_11417 [Halopenitus persicus]